VCISQAAARGGAGGLSLGLVLSAIQGEDVRGLGLVEAHAILSAQGRPLTLSFDLPDESVLCEQLGTGPNSL
jgi:hypothetical protein